MPCDGFAEFLKLFKDTEKKIVETAWKSMTVEQRAPFYVEKPSSTKTDCLNEIQHPTTIKDSAIYLIKCNYFVAPKNLYGEQLCFPAELGLVKYSVKLGVQQVANFKVYPEILNHMKGLSYEMESHALSSHQLRLDKADSTKETLDKVLSFVGSRDQCDIPILYTDADEIALVKAGLELLEGPNQELKWNIGSIQQICYQMKLDACKMAGIKPPSLFQVLNVFKTKFLFTSGVSCQFHKLSDLDQHCAQTQAMRWTYIVSEIICPDLQIRLLPGKHMPPKDGVLSYPEAVDEKLGKNVEPVVNGSTALEAEPPAWTKGFGSGRGTKVQFNETIELGSQLGSAGISDTQQSVLNKQPHRLRGFGRGRRLIN